MVMLVNRGKLVLLHLFLLFQERRVYLLLQVLNSFLEHHSISQTLNALLGEDQNLKTRITPLCCEV